MQLDDYYEIGFILKPHGLKGAVNIQLDVDEPEEYATMESVFVKIGNELIPFFIASMQLTGNKGVIYFEDVNSFEEAERLRSCPLYLPLDQLPELKEGQFYYHEVIGYTIVDEKEGDLGVIRDVLSGGNQDLISMDYKQKEVLIPVTDDIVLNADHEKKAVFVRLPEGLLDIYL